jgi:hypothetical protein
MIWTMSARRAFCRTIAHGLDGFRSLGNVACQECEPGMRARNARNDAITGSAPLPTGLATETSIRRGAITWALTSPENSGWLLKRALSKRNPREFPVRACLPRYSVPGGLGGAYRLGLGGRHGQPQTSVSTFLLTENPRATTSSMGVFSRSCSVILAVARMGAGVHRAIVGKLVTNWMERTGWEEVGLGGYDRWDTITPLSCDRANRSRWIPGLWIRAVRDP